MRPVLEPAGIEKRKELSRAHYTGPSDDQDGIFIH